MMAKGSLTIVGTGIKLAAHITAEAKGWIEQADCVYYLTNGAITDEWVQQMNPQSENLAHLYEQGKRRLDTYSKMVETILTAVRAGKRVCAVFYGHPGIFVSPSHIAIQQAKEEGFPASMQPGISAEDCLFADLGIDPAQHGCQTYEATDFLVRPRQFDRATGLVLWQIGVVGNLAPPIKGERPEGLAILIEVLITHYGPDHEVCIYEAAQYPISQPVIQIVPLKEMLNAQVTAVSTLYVPPQEVAAIDEQMLSRLGLSIDSLTFER